MGRHRLRTIVALSAALFAWGDRDHLFAEGPNEPPARRASMLGSSKPDGSPLPEAGRLGPRKGDQKGLPSPDAITLETVLADPKKFDGSPLVLDGLYKIGTRTSIVNGPDGRLIGLAIPIARNDDTTICSPEGKINGSKTLVLLDDELASTFDRIMPKLKFRATINPTFKCAITVSARTRTVNEQSIQTVEVVGLEVLGSCNFWKVAQRQFSKAFLTVKVDQDNASVGYGDGEIWVQRLGGEQKFVLPLRQKFRDLQVRMVNNRDAAIVDAVMQRELAAVVRMAAIARDQDAAFQSWLLSGTKLFPPVQMPRILNLAPSARAH
jgi:hypothetical protein